MPLVIALLIGVAFLIPTGGGSETTEVSLKSDAEQMTALEGSAGGGNDFQDPFDPIMPIDSLTSRQLGSTPR